MRSEITVQDFWSNLEHYFALALRKWDNFSLPVRLLWATLLIIIAGALTPSCELEAFRFCMCNLAQGTCLILVLVGGPVYAISCFLGLLFFNATEDYTPLGDSYFLVSLLVALLYFFIGLAAKFFKVRMSAISSIKQFFLFIAFGILVPLAVAWLIFYCGSKIGIIAPMLDLANPGFGTKLVLKSLIGSFLGALVCFTLYQPFLKEKGCHSYSCVRSLLFVTVTLSCMVWLFHNQLHSEVLDSVDTLNDQTDNLSQSLSFQFDLRLRSIQDMEYLLIGNISGFVSDRELKLALENKSKSSPWDYIKLIRIEHSGSRDGSPKGAQCRLCFFKQYNSNITVANAKLGQLLPHDPLLAQALSESQRQAALKDKTFGSEFTFAPDKQTLRIIRPCYLGPRVVGAVEVGLSFRDLIVGSLQEFNLNDMGLRFSYFNKFNDSSSATTEVYDSAYEVLSLFSETVDIGFNESNAKHVFRLDISYNPDCGWFLMNSFKHFDLYVMFLAVMGSMINMLLDQYSLINDKAHQLLNELDERERYNASIAASMSDGVVTLDRNSRIIAANPAVCSLFGLSEQEIKGQKIHDLAHRGHSCIHDLSCPSARYYQELQSLDLHDENVAAKLNRRLISFIVDRHGDTINYDSNFSIMHRDNGDINIIVVLRNVDAEVKLKNIRSEYVAKLSHEMRTPLSCIKGSVEMLSQYPAKMIGVQGFTQAGEQMLDVARRNVARLGQLVNDVLLCDSVDNNTLHLERTYQLVAPVVSKAIETMRGEAEAKNITLRITKLEGETLFDELRLEQILTNLISNAIKYSAAGSEVLIEAKLKEKNHCIAFKVQDFGCGIPKEQQNILFNRYSLSRNETMRNREGLGLGLTICSGLVKAHGGTIWVESKIGHGSSFYFTLPVVSS